MRAASEQDLVRMLEAALYAGGDRVGDAEFVRAEDWVQITTPLAPTQFRNGVLRSILPPEALEERIAATIAHYRRLGVPFRWMVTPSTRPAHTGDALLRSGFQHMETLHAMVADPAAFPPPPSGGEITVERIGKKDIDLWAECNGAGWKMPPAGVARFREELRRALAGPEERSIYFLARDRGAPAGTSSIKLLDGFAHLSGAVVPEPFRRRGIYRAMLLERMRFLRERNVPLVTNHCVSTTSAPICARLGFRFVCVFEVYSLGGP